MGHLVGVSGNGRWAAVALPAALHDDLHFQRPFRSGRLVPDGTGGSPVPPIPTSDEPRDRGCHGVLKRLSRNGESYFPPSRLMKSGSTGRLYFLSG